MNKVIPYVGIPVSIALAFLLLFSVPYAFSAIVVGIPLMFLGRKVSATSGFVIGLGVPFSIYLFYPVASVVKLSGILSQLTGMPGTLLIVIYPLMYGIITLISALFFTGVREVVFTGKETVSKSGQD